jgi:2,4-dienoyl-CoA reductase [(3E)-enoyl-CoA-producing], peroxisomal
MSSPFKPEALAGKVAVVTGGGSGICFEITKQLLLHGCTAAIICGRRENFLLKAAKELGAISNRVCLYKVCDVRDPSACKAVVEYAMSHFGRVDILINGAAGNFLAEAKSLTPKGFKTVMDIDTQGTFNMCHAVFPAMTNGGRGGSIINISMTLHYGATWYQAHASAAKSAIDSLTRSLALEWGCHKIRVNGSEYIYYSKHTLISCGKIAEQVHAHLSTVFFSTKLHRGLLQILLAQPNWLRASLPMMSLR